MANEQDIEFRLKTVGETQGAEAVTEAIKDTGAEAKKVGNDAAQADPQLTRLLNIQRAQVAVQISQALGQVGIAIRKISDDFKTSDKEFSETLQNTAVGIDSLTGALSGAAQGFAVGGPFGAAVGGMIGLLGGPLKDAYGNMVKDLDAAAAAQRRADLAAEKLRLTLQALADDKKLLKLTGEYERQADLIDRQVAALQTLERLNKAGDRADAAVQDATAPAATPEAEVITDANRELNALFREVAAADEIAQKLAVKAAGSIEAAAAVLNEFGKLAPQTKEAQAKADEVKRQAEQAQAKADEIAALSEAKEQEIRATAVEKLNALGDAASSSITENANTVIAAIQQVAADQSGRIGADTKGALDQLVKLVSDLKPDEQQVAEFQQAIQQFRGSQDAANNRVVGTMDSILSLNREILTSMAARDAVIVNLKREIAESQARFAQQLSALPTTR